MLQKTVMLQIFSFSAAHRTKITIFILRDQANWRKDQDLGLRFFQMDQPRRLNLGKTVAVFAAEYKPCAQLHFVPPRLRV